LIVRLHNLTLSLDQDETDLRGLAAERLGTGESRLGEVQVVRRSVDARKKRRIAFVYTIDVEASGFDLSETELEAAPRPDTDEPILGEAPLPARPMIVGAGPAGLFATLELARFGYRPMLLERGKRVQDRAKDVATYLKTGQLHLESNILFGSGGAGTFSDGKLTTRKNHPRTQWVLRTLVECGAPPAIVYDAKPHVGTDRLRVVCAKLQERIEELGGTIRFEQRADELRVADDTLRAVKTTNEIFDAPVLIWAGGQHCRESYEMLSQCGVALAAKPFQMGLRIEHTQRFIDRAQYGPSAGHPRLPAADYSLVWRGNKRLPAVYSFCMCPGGEVIPTYNEPRTMVTNGWSFSARDGDFANAALVTTFKPEDVGSGPLAGLDFRHAIESKAHRLAGPQSCPVQLVDDFLMVRDTDEHVVSSFPLGLKSCPMDRFMPERYCEALVNALAYFNTVIRGFTARPALLLGPETRASSPVRVLRDPDTRQSVSVAGLYPVGEGAGYAGGIMTSILDGIESARRIMAVHRPFG